jgi:cytoskeleton protein RodZ
MTPGSTLAARRGERGLSIEQVAASTRIRPDHLRALEADRFDTLPANVYVKGYLRTYAVFLGLDAEALIAQLPLAPRKPNLDLRLGSNRRGPAFVLTTPAVAAAGLVLLAGAFAGYAWRQVTVDQRAVSAIASPAAPSTSGQTSPAASPVLGARPIVVGVRVTDSVWINVEVDGNPQYGDSGRTLPAGSIVYFTGQDVKITTGKAAATFITIDGRNLGAMGIGVATREFTTQTSP